MWGGRAGDLYSVLYVLKVHFFYVVLQFFFGHYGLL